MSSRHHNHQNNEVGMTANSTGGVVNGQKPDHLEEVRDYLRALEAVADHGRTSNDPAEVAAALRAFAEPSRVLKRLAESSRRCL